MHQFCKVFGKHGTPEYACGVRFPDFLKIMCDETWMSEQAYLESYYQQCYDLRLKRQVGSRYFVTASNASKIIFLIPAAIEFMEYTGKNESGNKLEKEVFRKLKDVQEIIQLLVDSLMYFHVYADLVMLSKSKQLNKSVLDMNAHYLELKCFLAEAEKHPEIVLQQECQVFVSESRIYGNSKQTNHRLSNPPVHQCLFSTAEKHCTHLIPLIKSGSSSMHKKLCSYAANQLPGGIYWNPEDQVVRKILSELDPSNDLSESLLGLNDYLTTAIPNLDQMARSNLVEVKKNKTVHWLEDLPPTRQNQVIDLAVASRKQVHNEYNFEKRTRDEQRRKKMIASHQKQEASKKRMLDEQCKLAESQHLIATIEELEQVLTEIGNKELSQSKKDSEKLSVIKMQVRIRNKILRQQIKIQYTVSKKKRPVTQVIDDFRDCMAKFHFQMLSATHTYLWEGTLNTNFK